jgi:hypothetical protein
VSLLNHISVTHKYTQTSTALPTQPGRTQTFYAFYAFYAWWDYFPQSGALAEGTSPHTYIIIYSQQLTYCEYTCTGCTTPSNMLNLRSYMCPVQNTIPSIATSALEACVYIYIYIYIYIYTYINTYIYIYVYIHAYTHLHHCTQKCMYAYKYVHMSRVSPRTKRDEL